MYTLPYLFFVTYNCELLFLEGSANLAEHWPSCLTEHIQLVVHANKPVSTFSQVIYGHEHYELQKQEKLLNNMVNYES